MRRKSPLKQLAIEPDPLFSSKVVTKLVNVIMKGGKKNVAQKHVYSALKQIEEDGKNPLEILQHALENIGPTKKVRPRRVGGASYMVPTPIRGEQKQSLAIRWLIEAANKRANQEYKIFANKLAAELLDAASGKGGAVEKKVTAHKMADANKAFAHFRW